jgi:hypothetical protein
MEISGRKNYFCLSAIIIGAIAVAFFIFNLWTPLIADDYSLAFMFRSGKRINSLQDIFISLYNYYFVHGGRLISFFFGHLFVLYGKIFFNISNTVVYLGFILLLYYHAAGSLKKFNPFLFLALNVIVWFLTPSWGEDFLWLNGSVVYLWPQTIALLFLVPYRKKMADRKYSMNIICALLFFLFGIIAGCGNETLGAAVLCFFIAYFFIRIKAKEAISAFEIAGAVGFLAGFCVLYFSPGTHLRASMLDFSVRYFQLPSLIKTTALAVWRFFESGILPAGLIAAAVIEIHYRQKKQINFSFLVPFSIAGLAGFGVMIVSPEFPARVSFVAISFLIIALVNLVRHITFAEQIKKNIPAAAVIVFLVFAYSFANATKDIYQIHKLWQRRAEYILSQKAMGILDIEVTEPIPTSVSYGGKVWYSANKYMARGNDITTSPQNWPNTAVAAYYGINSIKGIDNGDEIW